MEMRDALYRHFVVAVCARPCWADAPPPICMADVDLKMSTFDSPIVYLWCGVNRFAKLSLKFMKNPARDPLGFLCHQGQPQRGRFLIVQPLTAH